MPSTTPLIVVVLLLLITLASGAMVAGQNSTAGAATGCPTKCGAMDIRHPFGIGDGCYRDGFEIVCEDGGVPFLAAGADMKPIQVTGLSVETAEARVMLPIAWQCFNSSDVVYSSSNGLVQFDERGVYRISSTRNHLVVVGCNTMAYTENQPNAGDDYGYDFFTGCLCYCNSSRHASSGACSGVGCCQVDIPPGLTDNSMVFDESYSHQSKLQFSPCDYAFLVEKESYSFSTGDLRMNVDRKMPVTLDWAIRDGSLSCSHAKANKSTYACVSDNSYCVDAKNGPGYICNCSRGYEGNPYVPNGCTDINECERKDKYTCYGNCRNKPGSYDCRCPKGRSHSADPYNEPCIPNFPLAAQIVVGVIGGFFIVALVVFITLLRREKRKTKEFFEKNGGPILEKVNNIKLFKKDDLRPILKSGNIIGKGGFGEVYKGHIGETNQPVAVKKPINVNLAKKNQFANEVIIQSRVIHKNIVKLIGCCLEVDIPILVYEFVSRGSLEDVLHGSNRLPLNLDQRLHIAAQSAEALAYMHSKTSTTILHGDVKPANILLSDDLLPKISDFGISRLLAIDNDHTMSVIGDMTYMDPVYFQTGLLTDKSDVYSFGVVLLELITRKKTSHSDKNNLLKNFLDAYTNGSTVRDFIDEEIAATNHLELLVGIAGLVVQCLSLDVNQRPKMTDIAERLHYMAKKTRGI
ncbi:wall-associated receptor kinase 2-like [Oryza brachyantha]|uniref:wall-associated receptor kinase 2-like n=1 Tax=Oryza brachyantha TaxID=4533 RepID=UPI001ADB2758|nr:wall-associated receptor kinase 2-like [Oryza brachyantha]